MSSMSENLNHGVVSEEKFDGNGIETPREFYDEEDDGALKISVTNASIESKVEQDAITKVLTGRSSRIRRRDSRPLPPMGGGKDYPMLLPDREVYRVDFDGADDPIHPHNWPLKKKLFIGFGLGYTTFVTAWGSAIFASAVESISKEFHVANVVAILGVSLYVFGFASGPLIWAPFSELAGRRIPLLLSVFGLTVFEFGVATAKDLQTIMLCRFFAGFIGAAPLAVVGAAFADMFNNEQRGIALTVFSGAVFMGPFGAPVVGGFISNSYLGWRWTQYLTAIMASFAFVVDLFFFEETYHPIILVNKAKELRRRTGNWGIYAPQETIELDFAELAKRNLSRPLMMLFREPIVFLITIYTSFIYGILYLFLEAYPIVFAGQYHFSQGISELPYFGLCIGECIAVLAVVFYFEPRYLIEIRKNDGNPVPEARLPLCITGAVSFVIGLFWFSWTGDYAQKVHWIVPTLSGLFSGYGLLAIFLPATNYLVDSYLPFAASAIAANTFLRSAFGAAFPLFAGFMFDQMEIKWAGTFLGCVALVLVPVPVVFWKYGKQIRQKSKYALNPLV